MLGVRESQLEAASRVVDQTQRGIDLLRIRLEDATVRAPFDARVVQRHVEPGEWIEPGEPVVTLVSTGLIEARLEVPERFASTLLSDDSPIYVQLVADARTVPSIDVRPVPDVDPRARTFQVFVTLDNTDARLAPGMAVDAWVPTSEEASSLLAPKNAVIRDGRDTYVYRVVGSEPAQAQRTPVRVLFESGNRLAVESESLRAGDLVIVEGNERLMPGTPIALASNARAN